jgi:hypothetical protein
MLTALASGIAAGGEASHNLGIRAVYFSLRTLIRQQCAGKQDALVILAAYEKDPVAWKDQLEKVLVRERVDQNREIELLTGKLLRLVQTPSRVQQQADWWRVAGSAGL